MDKSRFRKIITKKLKDMLAEIENEADFSSLKKENSKEKIFISIGNDSDRASVYLGIGNSLSSALENAINKATKSIDLRIKHITLSVVTGEEEILLSDFYRLKLFPTRRGFLRYGIAFDDMYNVAFLEQEIYGLALIKYNSRTEQYFNLDNIEAYMKRSRGIKDFKMKLSMDQKIIMFQTKEVFYSKADELIIPLDSDPLSLNKGFRKYPEEATEEFLLDNLNSVANYLCQTIENEGRFIYGYFPCYMHLCKGYNVMRAILGTFALADLYEISPNKLYKEKAILSLEYSLNNFIYYLDEDKAFILDHVSETETEIKLGALGMAILAITKVMEISEKDEISPDWLVILRKLGNGISYLQDKSLGKFTHVLEYPSMEVKEEFRIVYYDGEALFGLAKLYTVDPDDKWMEIIDKALPYFIKNDYHKYSDHWLAYAINEVSQHKIVEEYIAFGLKNAFYDLDFIINRDTTWNTFLEMLNASWFLINKIKEEGLNHLLEGYDQDKFSTAIEVRLRRQLSSVMYPEFAMYFKNPNTIKNGVFIRHHSFRVRNDDVAHHIMGFANYYRNKYLK